MTCATPSGQGPWNFHTGQADLGGFRTHTRKGNPRAPFLDSANSWATDAFDSNGNGFVESRRSPTWQRYGQAALQGTSSLVVVGELFVVLSVSPAPSAADNLPSQTLACSRRRPPLRHAATVARRPMSV